MLEFEPFTTRAPGRSRKKVLCQTCGATGIYQPVGPNGVPAWLCRAYPACSSYVGVHAGTENALGTMANAELRAERVKAHGWIDRLWRGKKTPTRTEVYQVVSQFLGVRHFHVAQCNLAQLAKLSVRRADIERVLGRLSPAQAPGPATAPSHLVRRC